MQLVWIPLTDVRGSVDSECYRTATVRERLAVPAAAVANTAAAE
jgi:hypothetical protein